jgi:hypothetical protein
MRDIQILLTWTKRETNDVALVFLVWKPWLQRLWWIFACRNRNVDACVCGRKCTDECRRQTTFEKNYNFLNTLHENVTKGNLSWMMQLTIWLNWLEVESNNRCWLREFGVLSRIGTSSHCRMSPSYRQTGLHKCRISCSFERRMQAFCTYDKVKCFLNRPWRPRGGIEV